MKDTIRHRGAAAFGTRLRRFSEQLDRQVEALYRERGLEFQPRWFPLVTLLDEHGPLSVGELAASVGISHAAVSQVRSDLIRRHLVGVTADKADRRRRLLNLTDKGKSLCRTLRPLWRAVAKATEALCTECAPGFLDQLDHLEAALKRSPMGARVGEFLPGRRRQILGEYHAKHSST